MKNVSHGKTVLASSRQNGFDLFSIGKLNLTAGGVNDELRNEVAGDLLFLAHQVLFELFDSRELLAIGRYAAGIDGCSSSLGG